jgi:hypothetical protein
MLRLGWQRNKSGLVYIEQRAQRGYYLPAGDVEAYARECRAGVQEPLI